MVLAVVIALMAMGWLRSCDQIADAKRSAILANENLIAEKDISHRLLVSGMEQEAVYARSLRQYRVRLDGALQRAATAEHLTAQLQAQLTTTVRPVDTVVVTHPVGGVVDSVYRDTLRLDGPPITGDVAVAIPLPLGPTTWHPRLSVTPIPLTVAVGCREGKPPEILVHSPEWATVDIGLGTLDPNLCHPKVQVPFRVKAKYVAGGVALAGLMKLILTAVKP